MTSQPWIRCRWRHPGRRVSGLQWSHDLSAMDTSAPSAAASPSPYCFNGAMTSQPWIRRACRTFRPKRPCFNGAMTSQPWIRPRSPIDRHHSVPLQWSHDLSAMDTSAPMRTIFASSARQWSHDLSAMDTTCFLSLHPMKSMLQWSHDLSAMDTWYFGLVDQSEHHASMEP